MIIGLTANAFKEEREKVIECGGQDFVRKPFRETEIFAMLEKHLGVEFVYEQKDVNGAPQTGHEIPFEDLQAGAAELPVEILARLIEVSELCDADMIDEVIQEIRSLNVALADALSGLAEDFAYGDFLALAENTQTGGE